MSNKYYLVLFILLLSACNKNSDPNEGFLKYYGDAYEDIGYSVAKVENGYVIAGQLTEIFRNQNYITGSATRFGLIRTGADGNIIGKNIFGDTLTAVASKVVVLDDGSIVCAGYVNSTKTQKDLFVTKLDNTGNVQLQKIFKSKGNQYGVDILKTPDGFMILGSTDLQRLPLTEATGNIAGKKDFYVLKTNNNLEPVDTLVTGFLGNDEAKIIKANSDGTFLILGSTDNSGPGQGGSNILLLMVNSDCSIIQSRIIGGASDEYAADVEVLTDGYLIIGTVGTEATTQTGHVWKMPMDIQMDPENNFPINIDPAIEDPKDRPSFSVNAVSKYKTGLLVMAGQYGKGSSARMLVFATDVDGNYIEGLRKIEGGTGIQVAYDVITEENGDIITVGKNSYENNSMISLLKFRF